MSDATELEKRLEQHRCENSDCWLDVTNKACAVELIRAYVAERVKEAERQGRLDEAQKWHTNWNVDESIRSFDVWAKARIAELEAER